MIVDPGQCQQIAGVIGAVSHEASHLVAFYSRQSAGNSTPSGGADSQARGSHSCGLLDII
jgi:hypothetical protein